MHWKTFEALTAQYSTFVVESYIHIEQHLRLMGISVNDLA